MTNYRRALCWSLPACLMFTVPLFAEPSPQASADDERVAGDAHGINLGSDSMVVYVVRDKEALSALKKEAGSPHKFPNGAPLGTGLEPVEKANFEKEMIVAVFWGRMNFAGRDEKCWIEGVKAGDKEVTVDCRSNLWGGEVFRSYEAWPYYAKIVPRSDLPVSFVETVEYKAKPERSIKGKTIATLKPGQWKQEVKEKPENAL